jgi:hypothetical protein
MHVSRCAAGHTPYSIPKAYHFVTLHECLWPKTAGLEAEIERAAETTIKIPFVPDAGASKHANGKPASAKAAFLAR